MNGLHRYYSCLVDIGKLNVTTLSKQSSLLKLLSSHSVSRQFSHVQQQPCVPPPMIHTSSFPLWRYQQQQHNILISCQQPGICLSIPVRYQTTKSGEKKDPDPKEDEKKPPQEEDDIADLKALLKDKSLGITAKLKMLFKQYGLVMSVVYVTSTIVWITLIYTLLSNGVDIIPFLDKIGVFDVLHHIGFHHAEKLKSSDASYWMATYVVYELLKPLRYMVMIFLTMGSVRWLRRAGYMKPPPKSATVGDLMKTQGQIFQRQSGEYRQHYRTHVRRKYRAWVTGKRSLLNKTNGNNGNGKMTPKTGETKKKESSKIADKKTENESSKSADTK